MRARVFQKLAATVLTNNCIVLRSKINYFLIIDAHANGVNVYSSTCRREFAISNFEGNKICFIKIWSKLCRFLESRKEWWLLVGSFHQKSGNFFFRDCNLSSIKRYITAATSLKKMNRNDQILKILVVPILYPSKIYKSHLIFTKCLILVGVLIIIFLYCVLSTF